MMKFKTNELREVENNNLGFESPAFWTCKGPLFIVEYVSRFDSIFWESFLLKHIGGDLLRGSAIFCGTDIFEMF